MPEVPYNGKTKNIISTEDAREVIAEFKDSITALNNKKSETITGKGALNTEITKILFKHLNLNQIETHFIKSENTNKLRLKKLHMLPLEVVIRNIAKGSICKTYNVEENTIFTPPIIEFYLKNDNLDDPLINEYHILSLNIIKNIDDLAFIKEVSLRVNQVLKNLFEPVCINLADFKVEFGYDNEGNIILGDELSPDNMRLIDINSKKSLDKDLFRNNSGSIIEAYGEVLNRIKKIDLPTVIEKNYTAEIFILPRKDILNPESIAIKNTLSNLDYKNIIKLEAGKYIKVDLIANNRKEAKTKLENACKEFIANPVIEDYTIRII